jgi:hypothetical protein
LPGTFPMKSYVMTLGKVISFKYKLCYIHIRYVPRRAKLCSYKVYPHNLYSYAQGFRLSGSACKFNISQHEVHWACLSLWPTLPKPAQKLLVLLGPSKDHQHLIVTITMSCTLRRQACVNIIVPNMVVRNHHVPLETMIVTLPMAKPSSLL